MSAAPSSPLRSARIPFVLAALCVLLGFAARMAYDARAAAALQDASAKIAEREGEIRSDVVDAFAAYQRSTLDVVERTAQRPTLSAVINGETLSPAAAFEALGEMPPFPVSFELWGPDRSLRSWYGPRGGATDSSTFSESVTSLLKEGPIYSWFLVVKPLHDASGRTWHLVAKRLFDVNYPIANQFIDNSVFETAFGSSLGFAVRSAAGTGERRTSDSTMLAIALPALGGGGVLGTVYADSPSSLDLADEYAGTGRELFAAFISLAAGILFWMALAAWRQGRTWGPAAVLVLVWLFRYILIWLNVPGFLGDSPLVDPSVFASPFGAGLARSVADLFLTAVCLALSSVVVASELARGLDRAGTMPAAVRVAGVMVIGIINAAAIRGFVATLRSTVFDSTLAYNDPTYILPTAELGVTLIALSLIVLSVLLVLVVLASLSATFCGGTSSRRAWVISFGAALVIGAIYGELLHNPLTGHAGRTAILALVTLTALAGAVGRRPLRRAAVLLAAGALLLFPLLDEQVHELDDSQIELLAQEMNRPADAWMTVLLNQALDQLSGEGAANVVSFGSPEEVRKLAFTQWAKSILSRGRNNCSVVYAAIDGTVLSDFYIGLAPRRVEVLQPESSPQKRYVDIDRSAGGSGARWHRGYAPLLDGNGTVVGSVRLQVGEERGISARGGAPEFLTNYPRERGDNHYRKLVVSEYLNGRMSTSSDETFPVDRPLPVELTSGAKAGGGWIEEAIAGKRYETYYLPLKTGVGGGWISLSHERLDLQWHLYSYVRMLLFYVIFIFAPVVLVLLPVDRSTVAAFSRFKLRLTVAIVLVSMVPIALLAIYNKSYVEGRVRDADQRRLREQTQIGLNVVQRQIGTATPFSLSQLTNEQCITLAAQWGTEFNVYAGDSLQATSRPEVVTAELLDTRLSAAAYAAVVLQHHGFFSEEQSIGRLPYLVGYRPILSDDGRVIGTFSVPTLYRQREIDEMATRRNVFLFGTYTLALLIALVLSTVVVNQLSKPILRLKEATGLVAAGNLDLRVRSGRRDEIGELEESFDEMTAHLKRSQEEIAKTQRELAWREMARQVAHEIKNPLTPMRLSIQHLRQAYADRAAGFDALLGRITTTVLEQIDALSRIASEFSSFARMPERTLQPCSIHAILRDVTTLYQQEQLAFALALDAPRDVVRGDPDELRRVMINIVRNAVQAMDGKGRVSVMTAVEGERLTVRIADSGPGIPADVRARLFEPNFSTKSEGMGLGLAIVKRAIEDLGGSVAVESLPGSGTTFILTIPLMPS